ncbi:MAG TPA: Ig-like domain-containing protein, partial [Verrucomicrobiae bacterium]|nr:Ig-like domain-containing protein [Verrucomicrobiae bacterium]
VMMTPAPDQFGSTTITLTVADANGGTASDSFLLTVTGVNDRPFFTKGADQRVSEDSGPHTVGTWATAISAGAANESAQLLNFIVSNNNHPLFSAQPAIAANGTLTFTAASNANGSATVTVELHDNGGTANAGSDTSLPQTFTINVTPVNDPPILAPIANRTIHQGFLLTMTNGASDVDFPADQLTYSLGQAPAGAEIDSLSGMFTWTPALEQANSTNQITVIVTDDGSPPLSDSRSFTVVVRPPPLIHAISFSGSSVALVWSAISGTGYGVQYKSSFDEIGWTDLAGKVIADGDSATKVDSIDSAPQRFYRVVVLR